MIDTTAAPVCRAARADERDTLHGVWASTFDDDEGFISWLFNERFAPAFCPVIEVDGRLAACAHALPAVIRARDSLLPCAILGGVATLPDFRKQGMMHRLLGFFMRRMRAEGIALVPHRPARLETFFSIGHYPVCDMKYARRLPEYPGAASPCVRQGGWREDGSSLYACYLAFSRRYSGVIHRSYADHQLKFRDYASCGAVILVYEEQSCVKGYAVGFEDSGGFLLDECVAVDNGIYQALFDAFAAARPGLEFTMRLPPDASLRKDIPCQTLPRAVLGVANASMLLKATGLSGGAVEIKDAIVPENNGVFALDGSPSRESPRVSLSAGHMAQWALGYKSLEELAREGDAVIYDSGVARVMDTIGKKVCYIVDEY